MIKTPRLSYYKNSLVLTFVANQLQVVNNHPTLTIFDAPKMALQTAYDTMAASFKQDVSSIKTEELKALDKKRDEAIRGITQLVDAYQRHPNEAKSQAGEAILRSIRKYAKNITRLGYQEETAIIKDIIDHWTNDPALAAAIATLGLAEWQTELAEANHAFDALYIARNKESAQKKAQVPTAEARKEVETRFQALAQHVGAYWIIHPSEELNQLVEEMNSLIEKYNREVTRRGRKGEEEVD